MQGSNSRSIGSRGLLGPAASSSRLSGSGSVCCTSGRMSLRGVRLLGPRTAVPDAGIGRIDAAEDASAVAHHDVRALYEPPTQLTTNTSAAAGRGRGRAGHEDKACTYGNVAVGGREDKVEAAPGERLVGGKDLRGPRARLLTHRSRRRCGIQRRLSHSRSQLPGHGNTKGRFFESLRVSAAMGLASAAEHEQRTCCKCAGTGSRSCKRR